MSELPNNSPEESDSPSKQFKTSIKSISSQMKGNLPTDPSLYSTNELSNRTENFNIMDPYPDMSNSTLQNQNPTLFVFRNKPVPIKPEINNPKQQRSKTAHAALRSSLLQKRPLTSLKEPTILSVEVNKRRIEEERQTIAFKDDPLAYFSKKKNGHGHRFIYLEYKNSPKDPHFSPYELDKIPSALVGEDFFTMSATSITHTYPDGTTETVSLAVWANQKSNYDTLRKLKLFSNFFYWKSFRIWRNFVKQQRYNSLGNKALSHPFFRNSAFFKQSLEFYNLQLEPYEMLRNLLITFNSQRKYKLEEFKDLSYRNNYQLKNDYSDFIEETTNKICQLYIDISDPQLVQVQDSDFPQIKRRNPNLNQLLVLEKTKAEKRLENTKNVNSEIERIGGYIRMIDYMLLETLVDGCIKCWTNADNNVSQPNSNVFQVEVLFDEEGQVAFNPKHDDLIEAISDSLDNSVNTLNKLPRLLYQSRLQQFLRDNGSDVAKLFSEGPNFSQLMTCSTVLKTVKQHITEIVSNSYKEAFLFSQTFADFYPIFKIGKTWDIRDYVFTKSGKKYEGPLTFDNVTHLHSGEPPDDFLVHSDEQPVVDFNRVAQDIEKYREEIKRVNGLRSGAVRGAIYIDAHGLKAALIPIPQRSVLELQELITNLTTRKIWLLTNALKYYSTKLKIVPQTLDDYVAFCAVFQQTIKVLPQIKEDIEFIDKMFKLFDEFGFVHTQNTVHAVYSIFITDQTIAQITRDDCLGMFTDALKGSLRQIEGRIRKYQDKASSIPVSIKEADVDSNLPHAQKLCEKIEKLRSRVETIVYQQSVMGIEINKFNSFDKLIKSAHFAVDLFEALQQWNQIGRTMTHVPFAQINMKKFRVDIENLKDKASLLQREVDNPQNYPILNELIMKIQETAPFVEQLELLAFGKMQLRHWNMLFEACDRQNAYHDDITIEELMNLGILRARDKIAEITATSQGESELESEFMSITNYWNKVQIPLADSPSKMTEETLLLGPTEPLLVEIQDTLVTLNKMLSFPYVQGIQESVTSLYSTLENLSQIIEAWQLFQLNWVILSALFSMDEAKSILPHQANKFSSVQRKWLAIARFTLKDPRLFMVATYPSLLLVLNENNITMEAILASLGKFIDAKRFSSPRLCFLSNQEVLIIATSVTNYTYLLQNLPKIFMNVSGIISNVNEKKEVKKAIENQEQQQDENKKDKNTNDENNENSNNANTQDENVSNENTQDENVSNENTNSENTNNENAKDENAKDENIIEEIEIKNTFQPLQIYGLIGDDGTSFRFEHPVMCKGQMHIWIKKLLQEMQLSVKTQIIESIKILRESETFLEWANKTSPYIQLIALHADFTNDVEQCLSSLEKDPQSLKDYEIKINKRVSDIRRELEKSYENEYKYSCLITQLIKLRDQVHKLLEDDPDDDSSYSLRWSHLFKIRYEALKNNMSIIFIEFMDQKFEFGYEFWGKIPNMVYSPTIDDSILALTFYWMKQKVPLLNSTNSSGKHLLLTSCACLNGAFAYIARSFPDLSKFNLSRLFIGGISSGAWLIFANVDTLKDKSLCYLFDTIRLYISSHLSKVPKITIENHPVEINRRCRFFLTANVNYLNSQNIPPQLKAFVRPISLIPPSLAKLIEVRLISIGCQQHISLSNQLATFIKSITVVIHQVRSCPSEITHAVEIIENANKLIKEHLNLEMNFAIVYCCYERFICVCDETRRSLLQRILYLSFQVGANTNDMMAKIESFKLTLINDVIRNAIKEELNSMALDLPISYLCEQTIHLISLLNQFTSIIIVGPPNSGKTTVLTTLSRVFERKEVLASLKGSKPYLVTPLFPQSDSFKRMFGHAYEDPTNGPIFSFGFFQSALYYLCKISKKDHILRLDCKLTNEVTYFLSQFIGSHHEKKMMLNTLDTFRDDGTFHVILETSNLSNATPLLLSKCGILLMHNLQIASPISPALPVCRLAFPNIPFTRAFKASSHFIEGLHSNLIKDVFNDVAVKIIKYLYYTPNIVCYAEYAKRLESGTIILTDILTSYSAILGIYLISTSGIHDDDEKLIKLALIFGFFQVCSGILEIDQIEKFDSWLCKEFDIKVPENWIGFDVSDPFWNCYNKPTLISMTMSTKGKLVPLDFHILDDPVVYEGIGIDDDEDNELEDDYLPFILNEVKICHAQLLPQLRTCEMLLKTRQNIIIHGPPGSGKSSFLQIFFSKKDSYIPIYINVSDTLDIESIISYIATHTPLISKATAPNTGNKIFVLIFEGLKPQHVQIIEFLRMITSSHTFPLNSPNDEKVFEFAKIHEFNIIITTQSYRQLPSRFLVHFCPIQLEPVTVTTSTFVINKILTTYGYEESETESIIKTASMVIDQYPRVSLFHDLLLAISTLCFIEDKRDNSTRIAALLSDLFFGTLHRFDKSDIAEKITFIFQSECKDETETQILNHFLSRKTLIYSQYNLSRDSKSFEVKIEKNPMHSIIKTLKDKLILYNMTSTEKIVLRFTPHVVIEWSLLYQAISCPGRNVILEGRTGSGRYSMTRFVAHMCECDFVYIADPTPEELLSFNDRKTVIMGILKDVISNAAIQQKRSVIFMRANNKNEKEVRIVCDCIINFDFLSIFNKGAIEELYERLSTSHNLTYRQRNNTVQALTSLVRMNVHVVISKSSDINYEINYNSFTTILFNPESRQALSEIALGAIENSQTKKVVGTSTPLLLKVLPKVPDIAYKLSVKIHTNQFYDFVDNFAHFAASDFQDINIKNENITSALTVIAQLENESHLIEKRLDAITPALHKLQGDSDSFHSSYATRKETINSRREKVEHELKSRTEEVQEIENKIKKLKTDRVDLEPSISKYQKAVEHLKQNEIETIRITAIAPPHSLQLLLEIFCLFLDLRPSYENGGKKLLMDPHFVKTIIAKVTHMTITPNLLSQVLPYFEQPDLNPTSLENSAPALRVLYDWIHAVCELNRLKIQATELNSLLEEKKKELEEFNETMESELLSIDQVEQSLESENQALEQAAESKKQMEKEYKQINSRKRTIDILFNKIDQLSERWNKESKEFTSDRNKIIGNSIIFAFYLVYCGGMSLETRKKSLEILVEYLTKNGIETNYDKQPLEDIKKRFIAASPYDHIDKCQEASIDAHHATSTLRTPLIIDPDGIVLNYIMNSIKHKNLVTVSQYCSNLDTIVSSALSDGKTLIVTDVDDLNPVISSLLSLDNFTVEPKMSLEIRVGSKLVTWDQKFKLYLTSPVSNASRISDALLARVTLIDVSSTSLISSNEIITNVFLDFFNPELSQKVKEMKTKMFEYKIDLYDYEHETIGILSDIVATQHSNSKYDFLNDDETIEQFIQSKDKCLKLLNNPPNFASLLDEYNQMMNPFLSHVKLCHDFWKVMSRDVPLINKMAAFSFHNYTRQINNAFSNEGLHAGILSADQHSILNSSLIHMTFEFVSNKIPYKDVFFFMFMSGFFSRSHSNSNKYNDTELLKILRHIQDEVSKSNCEYLTKDKDKVKNKLTEEAFDHLTYTNVINLFHYMSRFIVENYGPDYSSFFSHFQADSILTSSASYPTIIVPQEGVDPTSMVLYFISQRFKNDNIDVISLTNDLEQIKEIKRLITNSQNRGSIVLIYYSNPSVAAGAMLSDISAQMMTNSVNTNFRLIIIASSVEYISPTMLVRCKRIALDNFPNIRSLMLQMVQIYGATMKASLNSKEMKKISFATSLLFALIEFRHFVKPFGFASKELPNNMVISDSIDILRYINDKTENKISLSDFRDQLLRLSFAFVPELKDREIISSFMKQILPANVTDDDFSIADENVVVKNRNKWHLPPDGPISSFIQAAQLLPVFSSPEILGVYARSIRNWNMANWVASPFLKFMRKNIFQTNKGKISSTKSGLRFIAVFNDKKSSQKNDKKLKEKDKNGEKEKPKNVKFGTFFDRNTLAFNFNFESALIKIENLTAALPKKIGTGDHSKFTTVFGVFLLSEVEKLNSVILYVKSELEFISNEYVRGLVSKKGYLVNHNLIPHEWAKMSNFWISRSLDELVSFMAASHRQLMKMIKNTNLSVYDVRYFFNPKLLFQSYILQFAIDSNISVDKMKYEFHITENSLFELSEAPQKQHSGTLSLKGLSLGLGIYENGFVESIKEQKGSPFQEINLLIAQIVIIDKEKKQEEQKSENENIFDRLKVKGEMFEIPLYHQALVDSMDVDKEAFNVENGISTNFVWNLEFPTLENTEHLLKSGMSFFCRVPKQIL